MARRAAMTAELGLFLLILAFLTALLQACDAFPSAKIRQCLAPVVISASWLQALCITLAFALLITLRLDSDFSVVTVAEHSNRTLPVVYKIAGAWGNHEGSMLLWVWVLSVFGGLLAIAPATGYTRSAVAAQSALSAGFLLFILSMSNPFARQFPPPPDGRSLNPILQDMALSIHPPLLYLGYVGFSIVFSLAVAALLRGKMDRGWAEAAHPWILASWSALTAGIGLGSWWAYRVLGWGGFWFWDPVENASLMPWLCGTALLHSNAAFKKTGLLRSWVLLLSIITFAMSLLGTFLVRSGLLTSVHSFASDPERGLFILAYIATVTGTALALYASRAGKIYPSQAKDWGKFPPEIQYWPSFRAAPSLIRLGAGVPKSSNDLGISGDEKPEAPPLWSRQGLVVVNNLFLLTACATVLLGTLYPVMMEGWSDDKISVGAPYFHITFLPLMALPLLLAGFVPFLAWKEERFGHTLKRAAPALTAALAGGFITLAAGKPQAALAAAGLGLALWLGIGSLHWMKTPRRRKASLPVCLGHMGAALVIAGVTGAGLWKEETERILKPGDTLAIGDYRLTYEHASSQDTPDYRSTRAALRVTGKDGQTVAMLTPEYRVYAIRKTATSVAAIHSAPTHDLYAVIGEPSENGRDTPVRIHYNPLVTLIWAGCLLMALGGVCGILRKSHAIR